MLLLRWGRCPPPWPTIWATTNTFSLGATNTLSHTFPTTVSHSLSHHLACRIKTISNVSPSTFLTSSSQLHLTQLILRKTNQVVFYPQPPLSSVHFIITWRFNPTASRAHWHQGWGQDLQARRLWWDEPDHELVIGYNCPGLTDFTKSFSPVAGATEPQMTQGARPLLSQGSKRADLDANSSPRAKRDKARPPHLSWCGLQFVGRTPWQTECDRSATLPVAAAAPSRTWVHTRR